jgi:hypothetical protein
MPAFAIALMHWIRASDAGCVHPSTRRSTREIDARGAGSVVESALGGGIYRTLKKASPPPVIRQRR